MAKICAIGNGVIFQFEDQLVNKDGNQKKQFKDKTDWGFEYSTTDDSYDSCRWGIVTSVGPDVVGLFEGDRVLITALKWTTAIAFEGQEYWKTDEDQVLMIDDDVRATLDTVTPSNETVALLRAVTR